MTNAHSLDAFWMPFTANRQFKAKPRMLVSAQGMYYKSDDGRPVLDATAGLWCLMPVMVVVRYQKPVSAQIKTMDFAPTFQMGTRCRSNLRNV